MKKYAFYIYAINDGEMMGIIGDYRGLIMGVAQCSLLVTINHQSLPAYKILAQYMQRFT